MTLTSSDVPSLENVRDMLQTINSLVKMLAMHFSLKCITNNIYIYLQVRLYIHVELELQLYLFGKTEKLMPLRLDVHNSVHIMHLIILQKRSALSNTENLKSLERVLRGTDRVFLSYLISN